MDKTKEYKSGDLTVVWKPSLCMHSERCWRGLPEVFKPRDKPWIQPDKTDAESLKKQIDQCPSGALSYLVKGHKEEKDTDSIDIKVTRDGPLLIAGTVNLEMPDGSMEKRDKAVALCRCGSSSNKPYCDGSHRKVEFKG